MKAPSLLVLLWAALAFSWSRAEEGGVRPGCCCVWHRQDQPAQSHPSSNACWAETRLLQLRLHSKISAHPVAPPWGRGQVPVGRFWSLDASVQHRKTLTCTVEMLSSHQLWFPTPSHSRVEAGEFRRARASQKSACCVRLPKFSQVCRARQSCQHGLLHQKGQTVPRSSVWCFINRFRWQGKIKRVPKKK